MNQTNSNHLPSLSELEEEFFLLKSSSVDGIQGAVLFDSGIAGPRVGITIMTHGNEPSGLAALRQFRSMLNSLVLLKGSVLFILNNLEATERYFEALKELDLEIREKRKLSTRFLSVNMNRLPKNLEEIENPTDSEIKRAKELLPLWKSLDYLLDIHSTRSEAPPMIIAIGKTSSELYRGFPAEIVIRNIEAIQTGKPACAYSGAADKAQAFGIEAGSHEDPSAFEVANACVLSLLQNLQMLLEERAEGKSVYREYLINGSVFFPNESYQLVKVFNNFERFEKGDVLATGDGDPIVALSSGHAVLPPVDRKHHSKLEDEVMFLSAPVQEVVV
jgi:succinylglutamate desuccinylase